MGLLAPTEAGPLHHVLTLRLRMAGAESNVAIGIRRLGVPAAWIGRLGNDEVGDLIERELRAEGVRAVVRRDDAPTGLMLKTARAGDLTTVSYYRSGSAGSRLGPEDLDEDLIAGAAVLHVTGITPALGERPAAAVRTAIGYARAHGVPVSLDVNYRAALWDTVTAGRVVRELAEQADVLFAGENEVPVLTGDHRVREPLDLARRLSDLGPREVLVKRGAQGCVALVDGQPYRRDAIAVRSVDPVGAGDAFVAGYLAELVAGRPVGARLDTAVAAGAFAVTVTGDWEGLPTRAELPLLHAADNVVR
jgi:2-dehydro-3-deoxygluconokinase